MSNSTVPEPEWLRLYELIWKRTIASQMSVMRSSLLGSLLQVLKFNQARKQARVRVFELGRVFVLQGL